MEGAYTSRCVHEMAPLPKPSYLTLFLCALSHGWRAAFLLVKKRRWSTSGVSWSLEFGVGCSLKLGVAHRRAKSPLLTLAFVSLVSPPDCSRRLQENSRIGWKRWRTEVFKYVFEKFRYEIGKVWVEDNAEAWKLATDCSRFWPQIVIGHCVCTK